MRFVPIGPIALSRRGAELTSSQGGSWSQSRQPTIPRMTPAPIAISGMNGPAAIATVTASVAIACNRESVGFCPASIVASYPAGLGEGERLHRSEGIPAGVTSFQQSQDGCSVRESGPDSGTSTSHVGGCHTSSIRSMRPAISAVSPVPRTTHERALRISTRRYVRSGMLDRQVRSDTRCAGQWQAFCPGKSQRSIVARDWYRARAPAGR
jgi:hypothetical protein